MRPARIPFLLARQFRLIFTLPPDNQTDASVARYFHHNVLANFGDIISWLFGYSFLAYNTILPVYAHKLTDSPLVIGLIPALIESGWYLPQMFLVPWVERLPRKLPAIAWMTIFERLPFLGFAMLAFWQDHLAGQVAVGIFISLVALRAITGGLVALPYQELIATVIPVSHRGRFFGISHMLGGLVGVAGAGIATWLLSRLAYPHNFALSFLIGFIFIMVSYASIMQVKEPTRVIPSHSSQETSQTVQRFIRLIGGNRNYRWFLFSRAFTFLGNMAAGFLAVYGLQRFHLADAQAGIFTAILMGIGDRWGYKRLAEIASVLWVLALVTVLLAPSVYIFYPVFILYGLSSGSGIMADFNIAMEFGSEADRTAYIGLTRTLTGPLLLTAPLLGGWLVLLVGYPMMFTSSLLSTGVGLLLLWGWVSEPRWLD
jgi:MFS family permease